MVGRRRREGGGGSGIDRQRDKRRSESAGAMSCRWHAMLVARGGRSFEWRFGRPMAVDFGVQNRCAASGPETENCSCQGKTRAAPADSVQRRRTERDHPCGVAGRVVGVLTWWWPVEMLRRIEAAHSRSGPRPTRCRVHRASDERGREGAPANTNRGQDRGGRLECGAGADSRPQSACACQPDKCHSNRESATRSPLQQQPRQFSRSVRHPSDTCQPRD